MKSTMVRSNISSNGNAERTKEKALRAIYFSIAGNIILACAKWILGYFGHSFAIIADAIESTADIFSSTLVYFGLRYVIKPADEDHPYGHGKLEPLISFIVVFFLIISAAVIIHEAFVHIQTPHQTPRAFTLFFLAPFIIWKEYSYRYMLNKSSETGSVALKADAWHHRSDAISSIAAFIGIAIAQVMGPGYEAADDWAALFAAIIIVYNSYLIFRVALGEIMDEHLYDDLIAKIRSVASRVKGIRGTEKCYVRKSGMSYHVDLHALVDEFLTVKEGHELAHRLQDEIRLAHPEINHVLIHIEPYQEEKVLYKQSK
ncbi:MAG TPA: cation diffusion facilitator family transporter [Saprospiraceae bacterium]|nr:cation diffusion facilitator family transporter [Saprospiraceae bacterium]HMX87237.1 cation diffusion facilitator family transporter [Saprospiraceae bacterium]HMZ38683.1 cation diffusion facilitator family transporter [Saprospiraceae bacterium]HNA64041.1 cation diffusion facilitator family transporter [Saprospiraceae bacterium]HNB30399.1 cation diffusion facilitator family transporter [Saprospiraceae bacterium]